jgi:hypothetical protein
MSGLLMIGDSTSTQMSNVVEAIERFGVDAEPVALPAARTRWPHHPFRDGDFVVFDRAASYLRPELAVWHAARQAELHGAELRTHTTVTVRVPKTPSTARDLQGHRTWMGFSAPARLLGHRGRCWDRPVTPHRP